MQMIARRAPSPSSPRAAKCAATLRALGLDRSRGRAERCHALNGKMRLWRNQNCFATQTDELSRGRVDEIKSKVLHSAGGGGQTVGSPSK